MQAFTWAMGRRHGRGQLLAKGIIVTDGRGAAEPAVSLGTKPTVCLPLGSGPKLPEVRNGRVYDAAVACGERQQLTRPADHEHGRDVLVRVRTKHIRENLGEGRWDTMAGEPSLIICGTGASARGTSWLDGIFVLHPGDVLRIRPQGATREYALWIEGDGPRTDSWAAFARRDRALRTGDDRVQINNEMEEQWTTRWS
jgi:hypothetical protein